MNDRLPGEALNLPPSGGDVVLKGEVWSLVPLTRAMIYRNGQPWKEISLTGDHRSARFQERVRLDQSSWLSLTAEAGPASHPLDVVFPQAATNVIRIYVGDQKIRSRESAQYFIRWIEKLQSMAEAWPGWRSQREKDHVFGQFREARQVYGDPPRKRRKQHRFPHRKGTQISVHPSLLTVGYLIQRLLTKGSSLVLCRFVGL